MNNSRSTMYFGSLEADKSLRPLRRHYSADGSMEIKQNIATGETEFVTYIGGDAYSAPIVLKSDGTNKEYLYLHRDYQGTILAISNQTANVVEKRLFDAWGQLIKVQDGQGNILSGLVVLDRGYTGHEHLQSVGLVHMNGRLYDAKLHRFLQPDNFIQDPYNTQNYNRYGYVLNNPLKYTDPSGEEFTIITAVIVGAIISATTYTLTALLTDVPFSAGGFLKAAFMGGLSGAVTFGIGQGATTIVKLGERFVFQAFAHGTSQAVMAGIQGGDPLSAFVSGSLSSIVAGAWSGGGKVGEWKGLGGTWARGDFGTIAFGTISGGAGAALTKGNFWQGAATGLTVSLLNHVMHKITQNADIRSRLIREGYPADEIANLSESELIVFAQKVFPELYGKAGNPEFEKVAILENDLLKEGKVQYKYDSKTFIGEISGKIKLSNRAFRSYFNLASAMGHELNHAIDYLSGNWTRWAQKNGVNYANSRTEVNAYGWEILNKGSINIAEYNKNYNFMMSFHN